MEDKAGSALFRLKPVGKVISRRFCNLHICSRLRIPQFSLQKTQNAYQIKTSIFSLQALLPCLCIRTGNLLCYHREIQTYPVLIPVVTTCGTYDPPMLWYRLIYIWLILRTIY